MLFNLFILITIMVIYDLLKNLEKYYRSNKLINKLDESIDANDLIEHRQEFLKLIWFVKDTSIVLQTWDDEFLPPIARKTSVKAEFPLFDTLTGGKNMLLEARGAYKSNLLLAINPVNWVNKFIKLPSQLAGYIGFDKNSVLSKILNIIWWIILIVWWLSTPFVEYYRDILLDLILKIVN